MSGQVWDAATAAAYDESSAEMFAPESLDPAVAFLADLAGDGPALELAIGTGRVAIPLLERGVPVTGIELSPHMVAELRRKVDEASLPVIVGDMAGHFRYAWPAELDLMARLAGMVPGARYAGFDRAPFTGESESHVSVWRVST